MASAEFQLCVISLSRCVTFPKGAAAAAERPGKIAGTTLAL
jgi:hypothetical protein